MTEPTKTLRDEFAADTDEYEAVFTAIDVATMNSSGLRSINVHDFVEYLDDLGFAVTRKDLTDDQMNRAAKVFLNEARFVDEPDVCNETLAENAVFKILQARKERSHD